MKEDLYIVVMYLGIFSSPFPSVKSIFFYTESHQNFSVSSTRMFDNHSGFAFTIMLVIILSKLIPLGY
jgi:hypothetical protein